MRAPSFIGCLFKFDPSLSLFFTGRLLEQMVCRSLARQNSSQQTEGEKGALIWPMCLSPFWQLFSQFKSHMGCQYCHVGHVYRIQYLIKIFKYYATEAGPNRSSNMKRQLPITSSVDEPQRNVRSRNPSTLSMPRQSTVSLEQPHVNFQPEVQPTLVSGDNISSSSGTPQGLQALDGSTSPHVCTQCGGPMLSSEPPPSSDPLVPSTVQNLRSNITASEERSVSHPSTPLVDEPQRNVRSLNPISQSMAQPLGPLTVPDSVNRMPTLRSLLLLAPPWNSTVYTRVILREQPQYRTSQGQTSNHSQYQNPHIIPAVGNHDLHMDINGMSYEELLALEERIGKVNTGIKTSELSKFVKKVICCGEQDEEERCIICLEQYVDADAKGQLKCGHEYHYSCIGRWMEEQAVCPICRQRAAHFEV